MELSYAGVPLVLPVRGKIDWQRTNFSLAHWCPFRRTYTPPESLRGCIPFCHDQFVWPRQPIELNQLVMTTGCMRFGYGVYCVTSDVVREMQAIGVDLTAPIGSPHALRLELDGQDVSYQMYPLPPVKLSHIDNGPSGGSFGGGTESGAYHRDDLLLVLVDERFLMWWRQAPTYDGDGVFRACSSLTAAAATATEADPTVEELIVFALGYDPATIRIDTPDSSDHTAAPATNTTAFFDKPATDWIVNGWPNGEPLPPVIDALAWSLGLRMIWADRTPNTLGAKIQFLNHAVSLSLRRTKLAHADIRRGGFINLPSEF